MQRLRTGENDSLTELTLLARQAAKANKHVLEKAENILTLAELVAKLETDSEAVVAADPVLLQPVLVSAQADTASPDSSHAATQLTEVKQMLSTLAESPLTDGQEANGDHKSGKS